MTRDPNEPRRTPSSGWQPVDLRQAQRSPTLGTLGPAAPPLELTDMIAPPETLTLFISETTGYGVIYGERPGQREARRTLTRAQAAAWAGVLQAYEDNPAAVQRFLREACK